MQIKKWMWLVVGFLLLGLAVFAAQSRFGQVALLPEITIRDLMKDHIDPAADEIWSSVGTVIDESGTHEIFPKTPEDWQKLQAAALKVAELSEILLRSDIRAAKSGEKSYAPGIELAPEDVDVLIKKEREAFNTLARDLKRVANSVHAVAVAQDAKPLLDLGERMQQSCEACHSTFWYPKKVPSARPSGSGEPFSVRVTD